MQLISTAAVAIDRPARYGKQLVAHLSRRHGGQWDEDATRGWIQLTDGRAELVGDDNLLTITVEGPDDEVLSVLEDVVARHLVRFATHDTLTVEWTRSTAAG